MSARKLFSAFGLIVATGFLVEGGFRVMLRPGASDLDFTLVMFAIAIWLGAFVPFAWKVLTKGDS